MGLARLAARQAEVLALVGLGLQEGLLVQAAPELQVGQGVQQEVVHLGQDGRQPPLVEVVVVQQEELLVEVLLAGCQEVEADQVVLQLLGLDRPWSMFRC